MNIFNDSKSRNELSRENCLGRSVIWFGQNISIDEMLGENAKLYNNSDEFTFSSAIDPQHFAIIDDFLKNNAPKKRIAILLAGMLDLFSATQGNLVEIIAEATTSSIGLNILKCQSSELKKLISSSFFKWDSKAVSDKLSDPSIMWATEHKDRKLFKDLCYYKDLLIDAYECEAVRHISETLQASLDSNAALSVGSELDGSADGVDGPSDGTWIKWRETLPDTDVRISLHLRQGTEPTGYIITVEYPSPQEVVQSVAEKVHELELAYNPDAVDEREPGPVTSNAPDSGESGIDVKLVVVQASGQECLLSAVYTLPSDIDHTKLQDVREAFGVCFHQCADIDNLPVSGGDGALLGTDEEVRQYLSNAGDGETVFRHLLTQVEMAAPATVVDHREPVVATFAAQRQVAQAVLRKVCEQLSGSADFDVGMRHLQSSFSKFNYLIKVPKYNSLKQQTKERIEAWDNLLRPEQDAGELVALYPISGEATNDEKFVERVLANPQELFVMIVDECHFAPSGTAIPQLHHEALLGCKNFVTLLVSATPYNCLSVKSRVHVNNIIEWRDQISPEDTPSYIGFEHYFRSIAFKLPTFNDQQGLVVSVNGQPDRVVFVSTDQEFGSFSGLAEQITLAASRVLTGVKLLCQFDVKDCERFSFSISKRKKNDPSVVLSGELVAALGFVSPVSLSWACEKASAPNETTLGDVALARQHIRDDAAFSGFGGIRSTIVDKCPHLGRISGKVRESVLPAEWVGSLVETMLLQSKANIPCPCLQQLVDQPPLKFTRMTAKNGFTILTDYILSMAYFGSCRVRVAEPARTSFELRPYTEPLNEAHCVEFIRMVYSCCYFDDDVTLTSCNISDAVDAVLTAICQTAHEEMHSHDAMFAKSPNVIECLLYVLREKVKAEEKFANTTESQSWFTETDNIIKMLITERKPAPMVLIRVYDNDENRSMQTLLRHAMRECNLTINREHLHKCSVPAFSVVIDISKTKLLHEIEPYFRHEYNVGDNEHVMHVNDIPSLRETARGDGQSAHHGAINTDLKYEDLLNVPCLIILCEKGRMGDTFPHTLRVLDLRLRTGATAQCFLQEIGRMCRYPRTETAATLGATDSDSLAAYFSAAAGSHGVMVSNADTGRYLGVAHSAAEVSVILYRFYADVSEVTLTLASLVHPLPFALISPAVMTTIQNAVNSRDSAKFSKDVGGPAGGAVVAAPVQFSSLELELHRTEHKLLHCLDMKIDDYLVGRGLRREPHVYRLAEKSISRHYDCDNQREKKHNLRFLLSADCQVGKTGAYLYFLSMLRRYIESDRPVPVADPVAPSLTVGDQWWKWLVPRHDALSEQPLINYSFPKKGKYHSAIVKQRLSQIAVALVSSSVVVDNTPENVREFYHALVDLIQSAESTVAQRGKERLNILANTIISPVTEAPEGGLAFNRDVIKQVVNWDGRFYSATPSDFSGTDALIDTFLARLPAILNDQQGAIGVEQASTEMFGAASSGGTENTPGDFEEGSEDEAVESAEVGGNAALVEAIPLVVGTASASLTAKSVLQWELAYKSEPRTPFTRIELSDFFMNAGQHVRGVNGLCEVVLSVPSGALDKEKLAASNISHLSEITGSQLKELLICPDTIRSWIFTPSFCGAGHPGPESKLLRRDDEYCVPGAEQSDQKHVLKRWKDYGEVLVVRASQLSRYQQFYGSTHIIAAMPDSLGWRASDGTTTQFSADQHGVGYARRFSQLLASYLGLRTIWMVDDYVLRCWKIVCGEVACQRGNTQSQPASFAEVMLHIEAMMFSTPHTSPYPRLDMHISAMYDQLLQKNAPFQELTGSSDKYGVIGIWRGADWRIGKRVVHPIKRTYSVYSFFLLNVQVTVQAGLYFPCRPIWEDIEFNNLLDENHLHVCKLRVFAHDKLTHRPPPPPAKISLAKWILQECDVERSKIRSEELCLLPERVELLTSAFATLQTDDQDLPSHHFVSFIHNIPVHPFGLLRGKQWSLLQTVTWLVIGGGSPLLPAITELTDGAVWTGLMVFVGDPETLLADEEIHEAVLVVPNEAVCTMSVMFLPDHLAAEHLIVVKVLIQRIADVKMEVGSAEQVSRKRSLEGGSGKESAQKKQNLGAGGLCSASGGETGTGTSSSHVVDLTADNAETASLAQERQAHASAPNKQAVQSDRVVLQLLDDDDTWSTGSEVSVRSSPTKKRKSAAGSQSNLTLLPPIKEQLSSPHNKERGSHVENAVDVDSEQSDQELVATSTPTTQRSAQLNYIIYTLKILAPKIIRKYRKRYSKLSGKLDAKTQSPSELHSHLVNALLEKHAKQLTAMCPSRPYTCNELWSLLKQVEVGSDSDEGSGAEESSDDMMVDNTTSQRQSSPGKRRKASQSSTGVDLTLLTSASSEQKGEQIERDQTLANNGDEEVTGPLKKPRKSHPSKEQKSYTENTLRPLAVTIVERYNSETNRLNEMYDGHVQQCYSQATDAEVELMNRMDAAYRPSSELRSYLLKELLQIHATNLSALNVARPFTCEELWSKCREIRNNTLNGAVSATMDCGDDTEATSSASSPNKKSQKPTQKQLDMPPPISGSNSDDNSCSDSDTSDAEKGDHSAVMPNVSAAASVAAAGRTSAVTAAPKGKHKRLSAAQVQYIQDNYDDMADGVDAEEDRMYEMAHSEKKSEAEKAELRQWDVDVFTSIKDIRRCAANRVLSEHVKKINALPDSKHQFTGEEIHKRMYNM